MGKRRAHNAVAARQADRIDLPASARVAWTYLATLGALIGAGVIAVLADQTVAVVACKAASGTSDDAKSTCQVGWVIWAVLIGFLLAFAVMMPLLKLDWWLWGTMAAVLVLLIAADAIDQWWWWAMAALAPAATALASARWGSVSRGRPLGQVIALCLLYALAVAGLVWWWIRG